MHVAPWIPWTAPDDAPDNRHAPDDAQDSETGFGWNSLNAPLLWAPFCGGYNDGDDDNDADDDEVDDDEDGNDDEDEGCLGWTVGGSASCHWL